MFFMKETKATQFIKIKISLIIILIFWQLPALARNAYELMDHKLVLDDQGRIQPWTTFDHIFNGSMNYIKKCPTTRTIYGDDPLYLVTSSMEADGRTGKNQNNQGGNVYWAVETLKKYYAYTGDKEAIAAIQLLLDRVLYYHTPADWVWPNVPRTQDNSPDGEYTDQFSEVDKICMVSIGYINFYKLTGEQKYLDAAVKIADTVSRYVREGEEFKSPLPFRVDLRTGRIIDEYTASMIYAVIMFDELLQMDCDIPRKEFEQKKDIVWKWIMKYPMQNNIWSGYYEDVTNNHSNFNQQIPMETARYILRNPKMDSDWKTHIPAMISWVEKLFGQTKHWGATSIREQVVCFDEMSSHTTRYASIAAMWYAVSGDEEYKEEARASFAISTYSTFTRHSWDDVAVNRTGIGWVRPWFSDSYFDFMSHIFDGIAAMPEMAPADKDHILQSTSVITDVEYAENKIEYKTFDNKGDEKIKLTFKPRVIADGKPLDSKHWSFSKAQDGSYILEIHRNGTTHIIIQK